MWSQCMSLTDHHLGEHLETGRESGSSNAWEEGHGLFLWTWTLCKYGCFWGFNSVVGILKLKTGLYVESDDASETLPPGSAVKPCVKPPPLLRKGKASQPCSWGQWLLGSQGSSEPFAQYCLEVQHCSNIPQALHSLWATSQELFKLLLSLLFHRSLCQQGLRDSKLFSAGCRRLPKLYPGCPSWLQKWGGQLASCSSGHLVCPCLMICIGWRLRAKTFLC